MAARTESLRTVVVRHEVTDPDVLEALDELDRFFLLVRVMRDAGFIRCGDVVRHHPTGEAWVVAYADYARNALSWFGWPEGIARITECTRIRIASDEQHEKDVGEWLDPARVRHDHRPAVIRRLYGNAC